MASQFLRDFAADERLTEIERSVLAAVDVKSPEDIQSLVTSFPSIIDLGVRLPVISNAAAQRTSGAFVTVAAAVTAHPPTIGLGALPPPGSPVTLQSSVGAPPTLPFAPPPPAPAIDLRLPNWPVRFQGNRGTCVSFGTTACVEFLRSAEGPNPDYAEQFLYWAIKDHSADPNKNQDGTWLCFARDVLQSDGICHESFWPYVGSLVQPISGQTPTNPTAAAKADAAGQKPAATAYALRPSGSAASILALLGNDRPVAICMPVFNDPAVPNGPINWATQSGWAYGRVLNPPPRSVVSGGHCVCVTGFQPDTSEPNGGYFIFRNSWGPAWARLAPSPGNSYSPEVGYGEISATYVDAYCWEFMQL